ncbi:MAG: hypothetical protein GY787_24785 [Alteromonadales bacterium]|nr:hypothetical protein [Alteromonadales bacterium]
MELIVDSPNWKLLKEDNELYFSARICCGLVDSSVLIMLSSEESILFYSEGATFLDSLASRLEGKYSYPLRHGEFELIAGLVTKEIRDKVSKALIS